MQRIATCLMFVGDQHGRAEEAITFYTSVFEDSRILSLDRYGPGDEAEGTVRLARFSLAGQEILGMDGGRSHSFTFTPAISLFVDVDQQQLLDQAFEKLSEGGAVLMELQEYPFSPRFGWIQDRFGVSWQLNLAKSSPQ